MYVRKSKRTHSSVALRMRARARERTAKNVISPPHPTPRRPPPYPPTPPPVKYSDAKCDNSREPLRNPASKTTSSLKDAEGLYPNSAFSRTCNRGSIFLWRKQLQTVGSSAHCVIPSGKTDIGLSYQTPCHLRLLSCSNSKKHQKAALAAA